MSHQKQSFSWLNTPPAGINTPPVETRVQELPFDKLDWQDFERLCYRLARTDADVENCRLYGERGDEQEGIDIFTRVLGSEKYRVHQCKREKEFGPAKIKEAVAAFIEDEWVKKSDAFVLCTQESLRSRLRLDEFERQALLLRSYGISFIPWDSEELSIKLKSHPEIVDDFFGRDWVRAFCGERAVENLGERLDGVALRRVRSQLYSLYQRVFNLHDAGIPLPATLQLVDRYVIPDIEEAQSLSLESTTSTQKSPDSDKDAEQLPKQRMESGNRRFFQRIPIQNWIARGKQTLLFGSPGSGKSTFLRFLALDILSDKPTLNFTSKKFGESIPVWIPFALWTKVINDGPIADRSLNAIIGNWLKGWEADSLIPLVRTALKDKRLLLLVDGLDEYSNLDSAKIALDHLDAFLEDADVPIIATSRPHGFEKLGMKIDGWQQAAIADLSISQQKTLVGIWFRAASQKLNPAANLEETNRHVERQTSTFFAELTRSSELRELARNPLLLCLLISFHLSNIRLPSGRFNAYEALTDHLISTHPQARRVAAEVPQQHDFSPGDIKKILAHLAFILHTRYPEGMVAEGQATDILVDFLKDELQGFGMEHFRATRVARNILEQAENNIGIIVKRSQNEIGFYHRTIQEYLTSFSISRLITAEQSAIVERYCEIPLWRDVILGLFQITKRPNDIKLFLDSITAKSVSYSDKKMIEKLLAEVAFGDYNCPPSTARALAHKSCEEIELGTWMRHRDAILGHVLNGLHSSILSTEVEEKITSWFPDRLGYHRATVFAAMAGWKTGPDLLEALFKGLNAEQDGVRSAAAGTLVKQYGGDPDVAKRLITLVELCDEIHLAAAATEALLEGWKDHERLPSLCDRFTSYSVPILQFIGIKGKVELATQTDKELEQILKLARWGSGLYIHDGVMAETIMKGWPRSARVKEVCLSSLHRFGGPDERTIETDIAQYIILNGYPGDEQVLQYCLDQFDREEYPLNAFSGSIDTFRSLTASFRDNPKLIEALEKWAEKNKQHRDVEVSLAALAGRSEAFKSRLIEDLDHHLPFWPADALLKGWGMKDADVASALTKAIDGPASKASLFAHLLPQIIMNKTECRNRLLQMLKDPSCERYDFVMRGFEALGSMENDHEIIEAALSAINGASRGQYNLDGLKSGLIRNYSFDSRVRKLAIEVIQGRDEVYGAVATAYGNDEEIRQLILRIANPLPSDLRQTIASYLSELEVDSAFARSVLNLYDHDVDGQVKVQASIGFHSGLKASGADPSSTLERLGRDIVCYGPDYEERRLAAFCGLVCLNRIDIMMGLQEKIGDPGRKVSLESMQALHPNIPFLRFLLEHWDQLRAYLKEEFWDRLFKRHSQALYIWGHLARFADEYGTPRDEILDFLTNQKLKVASSELLHFLSRAMPGSKLLLEYCLNTIGADRYQSLQQFGIQLTVDAQITAATLLGDHFAGNPEALELIGEKKKRWGWDELILALSEGWPRSEELRQLLTELAKNRTLCWESTAMRIHCMTSGPITMYKQLLRLLRYLPPRYRSVSIEGIVRPIIKRVHKDDRLLDILMRRLNRGSRPDEKISFARLIEKARGLTPGLREWCQKELSQQLNRGGVESGFDLTTGEFSSVTFALYEILNAGV